jgi:hypothetical protein
MSVMDKSVFNTRGNNNVLNSTIDDDSRFRIQSFESGNDCLSKLKQCLKKIFS